MAVWLSEGSGLNIFSLNEHYINTVINNPLKGSSCIKLPKNYKTQLKDLLTLKIRMSATDGVISDI